MIQEKYRDLIEKIILATEQKKIAWEKTSRDNEYKSMIGSSMVTTDNWDSPDGTMNVDFSIWNSNGVLVDTLQAGQGTLDYVDLMKLYTAARASYLKADETIADILEHLNN